MLTLREVGNLSLNPTSQIKKLREIRQSIWTVNLSKKKMLNSKKQRSAFPEPEQGPHEGLQSTVDAQDSHLCTTVRVPGRIRQKKLEPGQPRKHKIWCLGCVWEAKRLSKRPRRLGFRRNKHWWPSTHIPSRRFRSSSPQGSSILGDAPDSKLTSLGLTSNW